MLLLSSTARMPLSLLLLLLPSSQGNCTALRAGVRLRHGCTPLNSTEHSSTAPVLWLVLSCEMILLLLLLTPLAVAEELKGAAHPIKRSSNTRGRYVCICSRFLFKKLVSVCVGDGEDPQILRALGSLGGGAMKRRFNLLIPLQIKFVFSNI